MNKKVVLNVTCVTLGIVIGVISSEFVTKADSLWKSEGVIEYSGGVIDSSDFDKITTAYEVGKQNSYKSGYDAGYMEGYANRPAVNASMTYTYHHHDIGNGDPTEVSFTQEEIDNGTRDAWFASHPVPATMTTPQGEYTVYHSDRIPKYEICNGDREPKGSYCQCPRCGATYPISQYGHGNCTARIITGYTYNNYYTPSSGRNEKELIRVSVELN